ncbi:MAG: hypothetical protein HRU13_09405 [Phycisphaerales bacterium]|nr:hypothetical protein [Phycisphaerales bacterium]
MRSVAGVKVGCIAAGLAACTSASAQTWQIFFEVSNPEPRAGETITITMLAGYGPGDYAVAGVETSVDFSSIQGELSNLRLVAPMDGPGTSRGTLLDASVEQIVAGQLNFPATAGIYADDTNPIPFWAVDLTVDRFLSSPVVFEASTRTVRYDVYVARDSSRSASRLDEFIEGAVLVEASSLCVVDLDGDGRTTVFDFLAFQNLFDLGDPLADLDGDGEFTLFDFLAFQDLFAAGC